MKCPKCKETMSVTNTYNDKTNTTYRRYKCKCGLIMFSQEQFCDTLLGSNKMTERSNTYQKNRHKQERRIMKRYGQTYYT